MGRTFVRQDTQVRNSDAYDDTLGAGATLESGAATIEDDLNSLRSQVARILDQTPGNWYDDIPSFTNTDGESKKRDISDLNTELDALETKRVLCRSTILTDVTVGGADNWVILSVAGSETPSQVSAIGAGTDRGAVTALAATSGAGFGAHELVEVAGVNAISPKNLCEIRDATTGQRLQSSGRDIFGLLQSESTATSGNAFDDVSGGDRVKISFVRLTAGLDDLEACPAVDIQGEVINYSYVFRDRLEDIPEDCFLPFEGFVDQSASVDVTRQNAYDNQSTTAVELTNNADLDLAASIEWSIRDANDADLFQLIEGSGGSNTQLNILSAVDELDIDAVVTDFANGVTIDSGSASPITIGVTDGHVETTSGNLHIQAATEIFFDDVNQTGSSWAQTDGIKLSDTTAEWNNFETQFGEVSLLNAIYQAAQSNRGTKVYAVVTAASVPADTDVGGAGGGANLDAQLPDLSGGTFTTDYDLYLNGILKRPGANAAANHDYYPGTSLALGQVRFEFVVKINDVICVIPYA